MARRSSAIGSPFRSFIEAAGYRSSYQESPRPLTRSETAVLNAVCPRVFLEVMSLRSGFKAMGSAYGYQGTSGDLIVKTICLTMDGPELSRPLTEFSRVSVSLLSELLETLPGSTALVNSETGEIATRRRRTDRRTGREYFEPVPLFLVSTLPATTGQVVTRKLGRSSAGYQVGAWHA